MTDYEKLKSLHDEIDSFLAADYVSFKLPAFAEWYQIVTVQLIKMFGGTSGEVSNFLKLNFSSPSENTWVETDYCKSVLPAAKAILSDCLQKIEHHESSKNKVFIVHGHDGELKYKIARILEKLGLVPIILHEQASSSRTIIEKIEKYGSEASAAIVLITPDDVGNVKTQAEMRTRARQNVVFEAGYFMGLLGRDKTLLIVSDHSMELPGDLSGVVYSGTESEREIIINLREMGFDIDANKLM